LIEKATWRERLFDLLSYLFLTLFALFCIFPFWLMIVASLTDNAALRTDGYLPWPRAWSLDAYRWVLSGAQIQVAYQVTVFVTLVGTFLSVVIQSALAYTMMALRRPESRNRLAFFVYLTMIFSGGIIPWFITCRMLGLYDNIWALIVPMLINPWWIFILRNFFRGLPVEILESARIDGASDAGIFYRIVLPLSKPALATVALFTAVAYWNDWWHGVMLLTFAPFRPQAVVILAMLNNIRALTTAVQGAGAPIQFLDTIPALSIQMATAAVTIGPIIVFYPFAQRYFIQGLTVGAVKG
jgi:ABC-type glycerol-3-phosphate transport system permease component